MGDPRKRCPHDFYARAEMKCLDCLAVERDEARAEGFREGLFQATLVLRVMETKADDYGETDKAAALSVAADRIRALAPAPVEPLPVPVCNCTAHDGDHVHLPQPAPVEPRGDDK